MPAIVRAPVNRAAPGPKLFVGRNVALHPLYLGLAAAILVACATSHAAVVSEARSQRSQLTPGSGRQCHAKLNRDSRAKGPTWRLTVRRRTIGAHRHYRS